MYGYGIVFLCGVFIWRELEFVVLVVHNFFV